MTELTNLTLKELRVLADQLYTESDGEGLARLMLSGVGPDKSAYSLHPLRDQYQEPWESIRWRSDIDSVLVTSENCWPLKGGLDIFITNVKKLSLEKSNHLTRTITRSGFRKTISLHQIPHIAFCKLGTRGLVRMFFENAWMPNASPKLSDEDFAYIYNRAILPSAKEFLPGDTHWPPTLEAANAKRDHSGVVMTTQVPGYISDSFVESVVSLLQEGPKLVFKKVFFLYEIQGIKGLTVHNPLSHFARSRAIRDALIMFDFDMLFEPEGDAECHVWLDLALEAYADGKIVHWRTDGHLQAIRFGLGSPNIAAVQSLMRSNGYQLDKVATLTDVAGCRVKVSGSVSNQTDCVYIQLYGTDKELTYNKNHAGQFSRMSPKDFILKASADRNLNKMQQAAEIFTKAGYGFHAGETSDDDEDIFRQQLGAARIEVRVPVTTADDVAFLGNLPTLNDSMSMLCMFDPEDLWMMRAHRCSSAYLYIRDLRESKKKYWAGPRFLTTLIATIYMYNANIYRPQQGGRERALLSKLEDQINLTTHGPEPGEEDVIAERGCLFMPQIIVHTGECIRLPVGHALSCYDIARFFDMVTWAALMTKLGIVADNDYFNIRSLNKKLGATYRTSAHEDLFSGPNPQVVDEVLVNWFQQRLAGFVSQGHPNNRRRMLAEFESEAISGMSADAAAVPVSEDLVRDRALPLSSRVAEILTQFVNDLFKSPVFCQAIDSKTRLREPYMLWHRSDFDHEGADFHGNPEPGFSELAGLDFRDMFSVIKMKTVTRKSFWSLAAHYFPSSVRQRRMYAVYNTRYYIRWIQLVLDFGSDSDEIKVIQNSVLSYITSSWSWLPEHGYDRLWASWAGGPGVHFPTNSCRSSNAIYLSLNPQGPCARDPVQVGYKRPPRTTAVVDPDEISDDEENNLPASHILIQSPEGEPSPPERFEFALEGEDETIIDRPPSVTITERSRVMGSTRSAVPGDSASMAQPNSQRRPQGRHYSSVSGSVLLSPQLSLHGLPETIGSQLSSCANSVGVLVLHTQVASNATASMSSLLASVEEPQLDSDSSIYVTNTSRMLEGQQQLSQLSMSREELFSQLSTRSSMGPRTGHSSNSPSILRYKSQSDESTSIGGRSDKPDTQNKTYNTLKRKGSEDDSSQASKRKTLSKSSRQSERSFLSSTSNRSRVVGSRGLVIWEDYQSQAMKISQSAPVSNNSGGHQSSESARSSNYSTEHSSSLQTLSHLNGSEHSIRLDISIATDDSEEDL